MAEQGVPTREIAAVIGRRLGWLAGFFAADVPASSAQTRELLGWEPSQASLVEDLEQGHYFEEARRAA